MLNAVELLNFKCFQWQRIPFRPLTLLTGVNSAGKSTVIQALLLMQQNFAYFRKEESEFCLSGDLINLGMFEDVLCSNAEDDAFVITIEQEGATCSLKGFTGGNGLSWNFIGCLHPDPFQYLQADRLRPQPLFPVPTARQLSINAIGKRGEFAAYHLNTLGQTKIVHAGASVANLLASDAAGDSATLQIQTEAWLSKLGASVHIQTERPSGTDAVILRFSFPEISANYYRPTNVGFGLTYALPIFVAALRAQNGSLLIVENPEAHLHPKGQSLIGHFLARAAACGVQVIAETHSDHVLNGIRVAVKEGTIAHEKVQINFFEQHDGVISVCEPQIDKDGHIDQWPEDFFDELDKQLSILL